MMRLMLKGVMGLVLFFCATLGAMRTQPYNDGGLRDSLTPEDCACFLGIRPGVTSRDDALALLRVNPWVEALTTPDADTITWTWNGTQPAFLRADAHFARIQTRNGIVRSIGIATAARMADVKIEFGAPDVTYAFDRQTRDSSKNYFTYFEQHGIYSSGQFEVAVSTVCPLPQVDMWRLPVTLALPASADPSGLMPVVRNAFAALPQDCR